MKNETIIEFFDRREVDVFVDLKNIEKMLNTKVELFLINGKTERFDEGSQLFSTRINNTLIKGLQFNGSLQWKHDILHF